MSNWIDKNHEEKLAEKVGGHEYNTGKLVAYLDRTVFGAPDNLCDACTVELRRFEERLGDWVGDEDSDFYIAEDEIPFVIETLRRAQTRLAELRTAAEEKP